MTQNQQMIPEQDVHVMHERLSVALLDHIILEDTLDLVVRGEDRVNIFLNASRATSEGEFADILRDFRNSHKVEGKPDKTASVRASEFSAMYYAQYHGANLTEMGYHVAIQKARDFLKSIGKRTNGKPILSDEEKEKNREATIRRKAVMAVDMGAPDWQQRLEAEIVKIKGEKEAEALAAKFQKVKELVHSIMAEGMDYAIEVYNQLEASITEAEITVAENVQQKAA